MLNLLCQNQRELIGSKGCHLVRPIYQVYVARVVAKHQIAIAAGGCCDLRVLCIDNVIRKRKTEANFLLP